MPIRQTTPPITSESLERKMRQACILKLQYVGESCVRHARNHGSYTDRTGNLRSSVGYVIVDNGKVVERSEFRPVKDAPEGGKTGLNYARKLASRYPHGVALIVVAGMKYAAYVQRKGYDVIASSELIAERLITQLKLKAKITHVQ